MNVICVKNKGKERVLLSKQYVTDLEIEGN
jgi:hypothetical protein